MQPTTPFAPIDVAGLRRLPGVGRIGAFHGSFLDWGDRRLWVLAPPSSIATAVPAGEVRDGNPARANRRVREGGWVALSQALASEYHLQIGQQFTLPSPIPIRLRVAALTTNLGWAPGALIMSSATYARGWGENNPTAYAITDSPGVSAAAVRDRVRRALAATPGLAVETTTERNRRRYAVAAQGLSKLTQIRILVLIAAILAVTGAMGAMIWQRRELIAFIKCHGYEEAVLWRWLLCETAVLLTAGCLMGAAFGIYGQLLLSRVLATVTGFPIVFDVEGVAAASGFGIVTVIAVAVLALPGYFAVRVPPDTASPAY